MKIPDVTTTVGLRVGLPKGSMQRGIDQLLADAGIRLRDTARNYRPAISLPDAEVKRLKPQTIIEMLAAGSRDVGFAGADWIAELDADLVEVLDTGLDPVRLVAAVPTERAEGPDPLGGRLVVASEYANLTRRWIAERGLDATFLRSWGATEVLPPEDADCIIDNTATGATLAANGLTIIDELLRSSTRLVASPAAMDDPVRRALIEDLALLLRSVLDARARVLVEVNVDGARLDALVDLLPCMRQPTIARLRGDAGFAVKVAVPRADLPTLIPRVRAAGGTDIIVTQPSQIVV